MPSFLAQSEGANADPSLYLINPTMTPPAVTATHDHLLQALAQLTHLITPPTSTRVSASVPPKKQPQVLTDVELHRRYKHVGMRKEEDTRCFNCLEEEGYTHRFYWMNCTKMCPACPPDQQHWGKFCSRLCILRRQEKFWSLRAGLSCDPSGPSPSPDRRSRLRSWGSDGSSSSSTESESAPSTSVASPVFSPSSAACSLSFPSSATSSVSAASSVCAQSTPRLSTASSPSSSTIGPRTPIHEPPTPPRGSCNPPDRTLRSQYSSSGPCAIPPSSHTRTRSRSPAPDHSIRTYRERDTKRSGSCIESSTSSTSDRPRPLSLDAPINKSQSSRESSSNDGEQSKTVSNPVSLPRGAPTVALLFEDPTFRTTIMMEALAIASTSHGSPEHRQHVGALLLETLHHAKVLDTQKSGYQLSPSTTTYLNYASKHLPRLMARQNTDENVASPHHLDAAPDIADARTHPYFRRAHVAPRKPRMSSMLPSKTVVDINKHMTAMPPASVRRLYNQVEPTTKSVPCSIRPRDDLEEGEIDESAEAPAEKITRHVLGYRDPRYTQRIEITEEDWEDLFKGDV